LSDSLLSLALDASLQQTAFLANEVEVAVGQNIIIAGHDHPWRRPG
jgi:hypothetical protein